MNKQEVFRRLDDWFHDEEFVAEYIVERVDYFLEDVQSRIKEWLVEHEKPRGDFNLTYRSFLKRCNWIGISEFVEMKLDSVPIEEISYFLLERCSPDEDDFISIIERNAFAIYSRFLKDIVKIRLIDEQIEAYYEDGTLDKYYPELRAKYMLLSRLKEDCEYYLGYGNYDGSRLWLMSVEEHISKMKELWNGFPKGKKPRWLTFGEILAYEKKMLV